MATRWTCSVCGADHEGIPLDWGFPKPAYWDDERDAPRGFLDSDRCVIPHDGGDTDFLVRGVIELPIVDGAGADEAAFGIGVWVSLSERNFTWYTEHPEAGTAEQGDPWFGWLSNSIPVYPETLSLKTAVDLRGGVLRPRIRVEPTDHPLSLDQRNGITLARAQELSDRWLHS
jgi:hypothetical protein